METYSVYIHTNIANGKMYIGLTRQAPEARWGVGGKNYHDKCPHFWNAIQKYGWDGFIHSVVATDLSEADACDLEQTLISAYQTQESSHGYNIMEGGTSPTIPDEVRQKMSLAMRGNRNGLGHPCSAEKKRKISEAQKGRKLTDEHKAQLSAAKKGSHHASPSEETRRKISNSHAKKPVYCKETDMIYESIQACAKQLEVQPTAVCACCKGRLKSTGGYHLKYYNNTINA